MNMIQGARSLAAAADSKKMQFIEQCSKMLTRNYINFVNNSLRWSFNPPPQFSCEYHLGRLEITYVFKGQRFLN